MPSLPCGEIRSQVDVNFAVTVAVAAWTFPCRKFNLTMKEENKTTTTCACKRVGSCASESAIAVRCFGWSTSQRLRRAQKIQGNVAKAALMQPGVPPTLPKAAQSRRRPHSRSRLPNPTPDCGHLEASATHQRSAVNAGSAVIAEAAAAETTSQPLCALLDHSPSAVARVRYRAILTPT